MNPSKMTPAELDKAACKAVGIEPLGWRSGDVRVHRGQNTMSETLERMGALGQGAEEFYLRVSREPAACARLKVAAIEAGLPMLLIYHGETVLAMLCDAVTGRDTEAALDLEATAETRARAETEERAVALAIVAWKEAQS